MCECGYVSMCFSEHDFYISCKGQRVYIEGEEVGGSI